MSNSLKFFKQSVIGLCLFGLGFLTGTIVDMLTYKFYKKIDPDRNNFAKLVFVGAVQCYLIVIILLVFSYCHQTDNFYNYIFRISFLASQIFLGGYIINSMTNKISNRQLSSNNPSNNPRLFSLNNQI